MDSPPHTAAAIPAATEMEAKPEKRDKEMVHKMKVVQFLGRSVPIILQNDNGPCPLLAICNVLSLKNSLSLSSDVPEISQEKLLSLVAERLIDSNINTNNNDNSYVENQQQNIADAIDLLPRLATGIDVNIKFRRIDDFEFTSECAIFDLLDIPLYHGWIVDPQDFETASAVGSKSYNSLMGELVLLDTQSSVDFVAATTATLGVPSPSLSRGQSFEGSPNRTRKGDVEEADELFRALRLSEAETSAELVHSVVAEADPFGSTNAKESHVVHMEKGGNGYSQTLEDSKLVCNERDFPENADSEFRSAVLSEAPTTSFSNNNSGNDFQRSDVVHGNSRDCADASGVRTGDDTSQPVSITNENTRIEDGLVQADSISKEKIRTEDATDEPESFAVDSTRTEDATVQHEPITKDKIASDQAHLTSASNEDCRGKLSTELNDDNKMPDHPGTDGKDMSVPLNTAESDSSSGQKVHSEKPGTHSSGVDINEPIYEGEECILESGLIYESREPVYEGEVVLAEQVDKDHADENSTKSLEKISLKEGDVIRTFIKNTASQLTVYGLFCLQEKVKERELCVFFRNNHFNTMFKFKGELYILATDQGYINQPDLVWEKLNEVNGDTVFVTGSFEEFKMNEHSNGTWDEQNVMASTAEYLAKYESSQDSSSFNSDLRLAIALQQQEFDQQQEQQQPQPQQPRNSNTQPPAGITGSRLVTGPQVSRVPPKFASPSSSKSKEKCTVM